MKKINKYDKFNSMANNHLNGNLKDFIIELKSLNKLNLLDFIIYDNQSTITVDNIRKYLAQK